MIKILIDLLYNMQACEPSFACETKISLHKATFSTFKQKKYDLTYITFRYISFNPLLLYDNFTACNFSRTLPLNLI